MKHRQLLRHKKKVTKECWSLDWHFYKWLKEHLETYLKDADRFIDLEYYKFTYNNETLTEKEAVKRMIFLLNEMDHWNDTWYLEEDADYEQGHAQYEKNRRELMGWLTEALPALWW